LRRVLRKNAKVELIKRVPLFAHCSKKELGLVAQIADEIDLAEGKTLMREGDRGREFFVLVEGSADVRRRNRKVNTLGGGDFFGEIALVSQRPRTATVTTTSPVRALVVTEQSFRSLLDRAPDVQRKVLQALADRVAADSI
jgi:CRP/FNR family transcriptional regulator, cyclic AMP receptor protein